MKVLQGLGALILLSIIVVIISALFMLLSYGFGWITGWSMNVVLGYGLIFGITFEQFIAIVSMIVSTTVGAIGAIIAANNSRIENKVLKKFKEYRGY